MEKPWNKIYKKNIHNFYFIKYSIIRVFFFVYCISVIMFFISYVTWTKYSWNVVWKFQNNLVKDYFFISILFVHDIVENSSGGVLCSLLVRISFYFLSMCGFKLNWFCGKQKVPRISISMKNCWTLKLILTVWRANVHFNLVKV